MDASANGASLPSTPAFTAACQNGIPRYYFPALLRLDGIRHAVFTRLGGVSSPPFDCLNVGFDAGDHPRAVQENLQRIAADMGIAAIAYGRQVHGDQILIIRSPLPSTWSQRYLFHGVDGYLTAVAGIGLMVKVADCQPVFVVDPDRRALGVFHVGWRGNVLNILAKGVALMQKEFSSDPGGLLAGIGPGLGPCCAEFRNYRDEFPAWLWRYRVGGCNFDLWALSRDQLLAAGLQEENIAVAGLCTKCNPEIFFSYRAAGRTGRNAAVIALI